MSKKDIKVPNIGEFKDVEVIEVLIKKGQKIKKNDPLITIESDKSSVEIPSPSEGLIKDLKVKNMILVTRTRKKIIGLEGFGLKIKKQEIIK